MDDDVGKRRHLGQVGDAKHMTVAIVGGAGRVGLPLAVSSCLAGFETYIIDSDLGAIRMLKEGIAPFIEQGLDAALKDAISTGRLHFCSDDKSVPEVDILFVSVGTPLGAEGKPSTSVPELAIYLANRLLVDGGTLAIRSTVTVGTAEEVETALAGSQKNVSVVSSPERILEGHGLAEIKSLPQILGSTKEPRESIVHFFQELGTSVIRCSLREAEMAKLVSNAYRMVNFALANELAEICRESGVEYSRVRAAVVTDYPRAAGLARAAFVGGTCLPKDTVQLISAYPVGARILKAVSEANSDIPRNFVDFVEKTVGGIEGRAVGLLGLSFKPQSDDIRDSVSYIVWEELESRGALVRPSDPFVPSSQEPRNLSFETVLEDVELVIVATDHQQYQGIDFPCPVFRMG